MTGNCSNASACSYKHVIESSARGVGGDSGSGSSGNSAGISAGTCLAVLDNGVAVQGVHDAKLNADREVVRQMPLGVCFTFWKSGQCQLGTVCKFKHQRAKPQLPPGSLQDAPQQRAQRTCHDLDVPSGKRHKAVHLNIGSCQVPVGQSEACQQDVGSTKHGHGTTAQCMPALQQEFEQALPKLMALTAYCIKRTVPDSHEAWLRELMQDVHLVTGYAPSQVLAVTRTLLRHLIHTLQPRHQDHEGARAHTQARAGAGGSNKAGTQEDADYSASLLAAFAPNSASAPVSTLHAQFALLHAVKVVSIGRLQQRATCVRTNLPDALCLPHPLDTPTTIREACPMGVCFTHWRTALCQLGQKCQYKHMDRRERAVGKQEAHVSSPPHVSSAPHQPHLSTAPHATVAASMRTEVILGELCSHGLRLTGAHTLAAAPAAERAWPYDGDAACPHDSDAASHAVPVAKHLKPAAPPHDTVGVVYMRDATGGVPVEMAQGLQGLDVADSLFLASAFNFVHVPCQHSATPRPHPTTPRPVEADEAGRERGCSTCAQVACAQVACDKDSYLELSEAQILAPSPAPHYALPSSALLAKVKLVKAADLDCVLFPHPRPGGGLNLRQPPACVHVQGVVVSISALMCMQKRDASRVHYFILELDAQDYFAHAHGAAQIGDGAGAGAGGVGRGPSARARAREGCLVVFQGLELMKWYPFLRVGREVVLTSLRRAHLDGHLPCLRASLPPSPAGAVTASGTETAIEAQMLLGTKVIFVFSPSIPPQLALVWVYVGVRVGVCGCMQVPQPAPYPPHAILHSPTLARSLATWVTSAFGGILQKRTRRQHKTPFTKKKTT